MALSWNEIKDRALQFTQEWKDETREQAEAKSFWDDFFYVFGITRRRVATFEEPVKKLNDQYGFIDLFWKGTLLVEHKSRGKDLDKAYSQALDYFNGLQEHELPQYVLVSDFERFRLYDLDENEQYEFNISEFYKNVKQFGFIAGYQKRAFKEEDPVNIHAAELMGQLHDQLKESGYEGHPLEVFLVRLLFSLFADDTGIFEKDTFKELIEQKTREDGSDLGSVLAQFFQVLNTSKDKRLKTLDEQLDMFPYVNGQLFEEPLSIASFNSKMRSILLQCCGLDWGQISPAIFGSLFQSVMNPQERRNLGAHYTSEKNILKLIKPLFLDELLIEFEKVKNNRTRLIEFHQKIAALKFLDPACGCGNFLVITYRELRLLELEILRELNKTGQTFLDVAEIVWVDVDQFYGIEIDEWPARIAEVAMWLMDHQMNLKISEEFGKYFARLPLRKAAKIVQANALRIDWAEVVPKNQLNYILGNPPFYGTSLQNQDQKEDMKIVFGNVSGAGTLDYVAGWYIRAAQYINDTKIKVAFVSTNSISQGEQVGYLWNELYNQYGIIIHFAHRTFKWNNESKGMAAVHVVIIGFAAFDSVSKFIYEYERLDGDPHHKKVRNINAYLLDSSNLLISKHDIPISNVPAMSKGSQPTDDGNLLFTDEEMLDFIKLEPQAKKYIRPFISAREFINRKKRWCLWLIDANPSEIKHMLYLSRRLDAVKAFRLASKKAATRKWAHFPTLFTENRQPNSNYLLIPRHSSENRIYIPFGYFEPSNIVADSCSYVSDANLYHFGNLTSLMHMVWIKYVCGRIKSDYRYSNSIVYNNYPWPESPSEKNIKRVEEKAQKVLDVRDEFPESSLADLYNPVTMPPKLVKAHKELDKAVDLCYRPQPFPNETARIEFLFDLYNQYTAGLFKEEKKKKR